VTAIRDVVRAEVRRALEELLGGLTGSPRRGGRRARSARRKWRPGGPGRPPKDVVEAAKP